MSHPGTQQVQRIDHIIAEIPGRFFDGLADIGKGGKVNHCVEPRLGEIGFKPVPIT